MAPAPLFWTLLREANPPLMEQKHAPRAASTAALGWVFGTLQVLLLVPWFAQFTPLGYPVASAWWGLLAAVWALAAAAVLRRAPVAAAPVVLASGWTLLEWVHAQGPLAFPWGTLASTQHRYPLALQLLDVTGSYGLSFLMALTAASGAFVLHTRTSRTGRRNGSRRDPTARAALLWLLASGLLVAASLGRGAWILGHPASVLKTARVAVVQQGHSFAIPGVAVFTRNNWGDYAEATRQAQRDGAELVVWPETACREDAVHDGLTRSLLASLLAEGRSSLLTGSFVASSAGAGESNSAVMLGPDAAVLGVYDKVRIVPFGEYLPARPLLAWTTTLGMPAEDLRPGLEWRPLAWSGGRVGVSICFESAFGEISRAYVNRGANLLAVLTSDGWSGRSAAGLQHEAFAPLRAVETRRSVARAAATGISELIDPYGRTLGSIPMFDVGYRMAAIPLRTDRTLYVRLGDWPVGLSLLILLLAAMPEQGIRTLRRITGRG